MSNEVKTLDAVLEEIDDFGKFQKINFVLICMAVIFDVVQLSFVYTAKDMTYRCKIHDCDNGTTPYVPPWLPEAVPYKNNKPAKCQRFLRIPSNISTCNAFEPSKIEECNEFVYDDQPATILKDFDIHCEENMWKLSLIGSINSIGHFLGLPIAGYISDRFGRRTVLVMGLAASSVLGFLRSFSPSYYWFLVLELLDATAASGAFSSAFILVIELVGPSKHGLVSTLLNCAYVFGEILLSVIAWSVDDWRTLLRIVYPPGLLLLALVWLVPESVRFLIAKGRNDEAIGILRKAAKMNGKEIASGTLEKMCLEVQNNTQTQSKGSCFEIFTSLPLTLRLITSSFCWMTCTLLYYGMSLNSVAMSGNSYLNFILTAMAELPAYAVFYLITDRIGRRSSLVGAFLGTGIACVSFSFIPAENKWMKLTMYMLGKSGATISFTVIYIFTTEIFPTSHRHSLVATCSMIGRLGSMVAPQISLLTLLWEDLPVFLFGALSVCAGLLSLTFPETSNLELPDTIKEAELLGKNRRTQQDALQLS